MRKLVRDVTIGFVIATVVFALPYAIGMWHGFKAGYDVANDEVARNELARVTQELEGLNSCKATDLPI